MKVEGIRISVLLLSILPQISRNDRISLSPSDHLINRLSDILSLMEIIINYPHLLIKGLLNYQYTEAKQCKNKNKKLRSIVSIASLERETSMISKSKHQNSTIKYLFLHLIKQIHM